MNINLANPRPERLGILSVSALADQLCVSSRTVRRWVAQGVLPAPRRLGRNCYWSLDEVRKSILERNTL
jgi:excisionase family DNA binding protein